MLNDKVDKVIEKFFESLLNRYQTGLETSMKGSDSILDCVQLLLYNCHKIKCKQGGSYVDSPDWMKGKKANIITIDKKDCKRFQYAVTVALNHKEIGNHSEIITKIKSFVGKYNWEGINHPSKKMIGKNLSKKYVAIAPNVLYAKKEKICSVYFSKHNSSREKQVIFLSIPNGEGWHCISIKNLPALLRGITSKHNRDFYCLNCFQFFATENKC